MLSKITPELSREREQAAWSLRQRGWSQARIAAELGVSQPAVHTILRRVERRALARLSAEVEAVKAKQSAQLEYLLDEALQAWHRSKAETTRTVRREGLRSREVVTETRPGCGDARFLAEARAVLEAERRLWGLAQPGAERERWEAGEKARREEFAFHRERMHRALADPLACELMCRLDARLAAPSPMAIPEVDLSKLSDAELIALARADGLGESDLPKLTDGQLEVLLDSVS